jgi:hypothetical protein
MSQPHITATDRCAARYSCYAQRNGPTSTPRLHPPRMQRPSPRSPPSTGARRVTPATLSGTVRPPPRVSIRLGCNVPAPHHCHRPVRGALQLLRSAERSRLRVICPFRVALGREQRVGPVGSLGDERGRPGLAAGTKPTQRLRHRRPIRVKSRVLYRFASTSCACLRRRITSSGAVSPHGNKSPLASSLKNCGNDSTRSGPSLSSTGPV